MVSFFFTYLNQNFTSCAAESAPSNYDNASVFFSLYKAYGDIVLLLPEFLIATSVIVTLLIYVFTLSKADSVAYVRFYISTIASIFVVALLFYIELFSLVKELTLVGFPLNTSFFSTQLVMSPEAFVLKILTVFFVLGFLAVSYAVIPFYWYFQVEHFLLFVLSVFGSLILVHANDLLTFYLALEVSTIPLYILVSSKVRSNFSTEGGLKYFIMGSFSSGLILLGFSFLYGFTGLTNFTDLALYFSYLDSSFINFYLIVTGVILFIFGLFIKIGIAPFHFWLVDAYAGAPMLVTFFLMTVPKIILWGVTHTLFSSVFSVFFDSYLSPILVVCVLVSFLFGVFPGLYQIKIKRLLIYSSIASNGFFLMSFFSLDCTSLFVYLVIYLVTVSGFFAFYFGLRYQTNLKLITKISELNNLYSVNPFYAYAGSALLFSMAGIPPLGGFLGKFYLYANSFFSIPGLIIWSLFFGCISTFYYIRLSKWMFFANSLVPGSKDSWLFLVKPHSLLTLWLSISVLFNVFLLFYFDSFINLFALLFSV